MHAAILLMLENFRCLTLDTKDLEIDIFGFPNFVLFVTFMVQCLFRFWLWFPRAGSSLLIAVFSTADSPSRARSAPPPDGAALQGGLRVYRGPFARAAAARPSPTGLDLCSLREHGKNQ